MSITKLPKQGDWLGRRMELAEKTTGRRFLGTLVRDDHEPPWATLFHDDDGREWSAQDVYYRPIDVPDDAHDRVIEKAARLVENLGWALPLLDSAALNEASDDAACDVYRQAAAAIRGLKTRAG